MGQVGCNELLDGLLLFNVNNGFCLTEIWRLCLACGEMSCFLFSVMFSRQSLSRPQGLGYNVPDCPPSKRKEKTNH